MPVVLSYFEPYFSWESVNVDSNVNERYICLVIVSVLMSVGIFVHTPHLMECICSSIVDNTDDIEVEDCLVKFGFFFFGTDIECA